MFIRRREESRMNRDKVISLADAPGLPAASMAFYDRYRERITGIKTVGQRNNILSEMQQDFETEVRQEPQNRDKLKKVYGMFTDAWKFYKKYADVQQSDEYWESVVDESGQIAKKYDNAKLAIALLLAAIDELERKSKEMPQNATYKEPA